MNRKPSLVQEHAFSRYMNLTVGVIEKLQQDYFAGRDLGRSVPDIDADTAAIIVAESLEADRIWNLSLKRLLSGEFGEGKMSDFERLCLWLVEREGYERAEHLPIRHPPCRCCQIMVKYLLERTTPTTHPIPVAWSLVAPGAVGQFTSSVLTCQKRIGPSLSPSTSPTRFVGLIFAGGLRYEMYHLPQP